MRPSVLLPQGLKPQSFFPQTARLKSCPVTELEPARLKSCPVTNTTEQLRLADLLDEKDGFRFLLCEARVQLLRAFERHESAERNDAHRGAQHADHDFQDNELFHLIPLCHRSRESACGGSNLLLAPQPRCAAACPDPPGPHGPEG